MMTRVAGIVAVLVFVTGCSAPPAAEPPAAGASGDAATDDMSMGSGDSMGSGNAAMTAPPTTDAEMIKSAMSAAPEAVSAGATILGFDEKMQPRTLRDGTNGWTCMPDMPHTPGPDPMCVDRNGMAWVEAWIARKDPPAGKMGFVYMLMGGSDASNEDPFAAKPAEGRAWIDTGPHVMIVNVGDSFDGYPTTPDNLKAPYIMWPNTPYRHLMIPVR
jgi:hypothetical protein